MTVEDFRSRIDAIDAEIMKLLMDRVAVAREIGKVKSEIGVDVHDADREEWILARVKELGSGQLPPDSTEAIYREIISMCKNVQSVNDERPA